MSENLDWGSINFDPDFEPDAEEALTSDPDAAPEVNRKRRPTNLQKQLEEFYIKVGVIAFPFDNHCGQAIINAADPCSKNLSDLAQTNPRVKAVLQKMVQGGGWGGVIGAHVPLIMTIDMHHGGRINSAVRSGMAKIASRNAARETEAVPHSETPASTMWDAAFSAPDYTSPKFTEAEMLNDPLFSGVVS